MKCEALFATGACHTPPTFVTAVFDEGKYVCRNHLTSRVRFMLSYGPVTVYSLKQWENKNHGTQNKTSEQDNEGYELAGEEG